MKNNIINLLVFLTLTVSVKAHTTSHYDNMVFSSRVNLKKKSLKVLHIGNSFTNNSTSCLSSMIRVAGIDVSDMCLYKCVRPSGSFSTFLDCWDDKDGVGYRIDKVIGGITMPLESLATPNDGSNIRKAFTEYKWDIIIIQQVSTYSHKYSYWNKEHKGGHLQDFINLIKEYQPQAAIGVNIPHASYQFNSDTNTLFQLIANTYHQFCVEYNVDFIIPYGTAVQNIRQSSINTTQYGFSSDQHHLATGVGEYVANATYFETLIAPRYGVSIIGNPYRMNISNSKRESYTYPDEYVSVTDENAYLCQKAAVLAVHDLFNINNPDNTSILTDSEEYTYNSLLKKHKVSYTRTFNNTSWQALYIPFSMSYEDWKDDFEVAYINGVRLLDKNDDGFIDETIMDVIKIKSGSTSPNMPYLIKAKTTGEKTFSVSNATLYPAEENSVDCSTTIAKYTFTGTYNAIPSATMIANGYYAMGGGDLIQSDGSNDLKPYRWYMKVESRNPSYNASNAAKTITINVIDDEGETTTGVEELQMTNYKSPVYDLNGRKVNENNLKPGIYVKNGKKFVVK